MAKSGSDAFQFREMFVGWIELVAQPGDSRIEDHGPTKRRKRQRSVVIGNLELAFLIDNFEFLILQHPSELIARIGSRTLFTSASLGGCHSISKNREYGLLGPFSKTSHQSVLEG